MSLTTSTNVFQDENAHAFHNNNKENTLTHTKSSTVLGGATKPVKSFSSMGLHRTINAVNERNALAERKNNATTATTATTASTTSVARAGLLGTRRIVARPTATTTTSTATGVSARTLIPARHAPTAPAPPVRPAPQLAATSTAAPIAAPVQQPALTTPTKEPISMDISLIASPKIDLRDAHDVMSCYEYAKDIYHHFRASERVKRPSSTYMKRQTDINEKMRAILNDWLIDVHHKFRLLPETLYLTINIIDRFLNAKIVSRQKLQLVGITAMLLASKYEEVYTPEVRDFLYISANAYTREELLRMERLMLSTLGFNLTVPTSYHFLKRFMKAVRATEIGNRVPKNATIVIVTTDENGETKNAPVALTPELYQQRITLLAYYFAELSLLDYKMLVYLPSKIASAAIFLALKHVHPAQPNDAIWDETMIYYTGYTWASLLKCSRDIYALACAIDKSKLQALKKKYSSPTRQEVAKMVNDEQNPIDLSGEATDDDDEVQADTGVYPVADNQL